jgi:demethylmenaquinone methyltransferase / 2-methoxy-6-polyprenyl-1,4-benzoquinol methylase
MGLVVEGTEIHRRDAEHSEGKASGTRPEGARDEREAAARVQEMFARIVPQYDFLNHLLSFSLDRVWRRRTAKHFAHILRRPNARVLDVCCGTGDLAFALCRARLGSTARIFGADFVEPMLTRARAKARRHVYPAEFVAGDVLRLPFPSASFDLITSAFGFRNLANYEQGLREIARVLKPGGFVGILEFSEPGSGLLASAFRFYFRRILPRVGALVSGSSEAYSYLPASVGKFPAANELAALMEQCGLADARFVAWNFGSVLLHTGRRVS